MSILSNARHPGTYDHGMSEGGGEEMRDWNERGKWHEFWEYVKFDDELEIYQRGYKANDENAKTGLAVGEGQDTQGRQALTVNSKIKCCPVNVKFVNDTKWMDDWWMNKNIIVARMEAYLFKLKSTEYCLNALKHSFFYYEGNIII